MVGVVGSSPIEPTNEREIPVFSGVSQTAVSALGAKGEYGYDTANVDRNHFGATLVEDHFRQCSLQEM
jgi:hypothetical protein